MGLFNKTPEGKEEKLLRTEQKADEKAVKQVLKDVERANKAELRGAKDEHIAMEDHQRSIRKVDKLTAEMNKAKFDLESAITARDAAEHHLETKREEHTRLHQDTIDAKEKLEAVQAKTATAAAARHSRHEQLTPPETTPPAGEAVPGSAAKDAAAADAAAANVSADTSAAVTNTTNAQATAGQTEAYNAGAGQTQTGTYNADTSQMTYTTDPTTVGDTAPTRTTKEHGFVDKVKAAVTGHTTHTAGHTTTHPTGQNHPTQYTPTALTA